MPIMFLSCRYHARCTMSFAPEMLGDVFFVGLKHVSVHVIVHPRRGIFIKLRHLYMQQIYLLTIIVTEENLVANSPRSRRGVQAPSIIIFSSCQITPQSLSFSQKISQFSSYRSPSILSVLCSTSATPRSSPTHTGGIDESKGEFTASFSVYPPSTGTE